MNLVNPYIFTPPITYNTYIGGVASTISTASALATKLGISVGTISNFTVVGSDIKCRITGGYSIPANSFENNYSITNFYDYDGLVNSLGVRCFNKYPTSSVLKEVYFPNVTNVGQQVFNGTQNCIIYIPRVTTMGVTGLNDTFGGTLNCIIYTNIYLQTSNSGSPDDDLVYAITQGATVRYVTNFIAPSPITNLSVGSIYSTAIQLVDNGISTNAIDYFESVKVNGVDYPNVPKNGYITGLTPSTSYNITAVAVDIFYNKSTSNIISQSTISSNTITSEVNSFESRVIADSGTLTDKAYVNEEFIKLIYTGISSSLLFWHNYKSGIKKDGGNLIEKLYSFSGANTDIIQTTTANKPTYTTTGITFDTTDLLTKTFSTSITDKSFSIVWKLKATPGNYYPQISLSPGSWDGFQMHSGSGGGIYSGITVANRFHLGAGSFLNNTDATYTFTYNSVSKIAKIYRNSTLLSSKIMVDPTNFTALSIDAQGGTFYDSKMFNKELSLTEINNIL